MSFRNTNDNSINNKHFNFSSDTLEDSVWQRNRFWLPLPNVSEGEEKMVGLHLINPGDNFLSLYSSTSIVIDWGDGVIETGMGQLNHQYDYNNSLFNGTDIPITFSASNSSVNKPNHGFENNDKVKFYNVISTSGVSAGQIYYVINKTQDSFQISNSINGTPLTLTNNGTATLLPYKQVIVSLIPTQNLIGLSPSLKHPSMPNQYSSGWLDILLSGPNLTLFSFYDNIYHSYLEQFNFIGNNNITNFTNCFYGCYSLQSIPSLYTSKGTKMNGMFFNCYNLKSIPQLDCSNVKDMDNMFYSCYNLKNITPLLNTASVTSMYNMFNNCRSLKTIPLLNTVNVKTCGQMFYACYSLESVPLLNTESVTSMFNMFTGCSSLQKVPLFNTANVKDMSLMFSGCASLQNVPAFNTINVTIMSSMFNNCYSLRSVPLFNTSNVKYMDSMFNNCYSLSSVPLFNTINVITMYTMFYGCYSLSSVPAFNTINVTSMYSMFAACYSLRSVPLFNTINVTNLSSMFYGCYSLEKISMINIKTSLDVSYCKLSKSALEEIINILLKAESGTRILTVTSNYGASTPISKVCNTTGTSKTISMSNTSSISAGMLISGYSTGISTGYDVTSNVTSNTLTFNNHGLTNGTRVSFTYIGSTTNVSTYTVYYIVNASTNTFQISTSLNGTPIDLTGTNSTMNMIYPSYVVSVNPNVSVTLDTPIALTANNITLYFRLLDASNAFLHAWSLTY